MSAAEWIEEEKVLAILEHGSLPATSVHKILQTDGTRLLEHVFMISETKLPMQANTDLGSAVMSFSTRFNIRLEKLSSLLDCFIKIQIEAGRSSYCSLDLKSPKSISQFELFVLSRIQRSCSIVKHLYRISAEESHAYKAIAVEFLQSHERELSAKFVPYLTRLLKLGATLVPEPFLFGAIECLFETIMTAVSCLRMSITAASMEEFSETFAGQAFSEHLSSYSDKSRGRIEYYGVLFITTILFCPGVEYFQDRASVDGLKSFMQRILRFPIGSQGQYNLVATIVLILGLYLKSKGVLVCGYYSEAGLMGAARILGQLPESQQIFDSSSLLDEITFDDKELMHLRKISCSRNSTISLCDAQSIQSLVNTLILYHFLDPTVSMLGCEFECLLKLIELSYHSDIQLCSQFWSSWEYGKKLKLHQLNSGKSEKDQLFSTWMPLCQLLCHVLHNAAYCPQVCFRLLSSLLCDSIDLQLVLEILESCTIKASLLHRSHIADITNKPPDTKFVMFGDLKLNLQSYPSPMSTIDKVIGVVDHYSIVQWDELVDWFEILIDGILQCQWQRSPTPSKDFRSKFYHDICLYSLKLCTSLCYKAPSYFGPQLLSRFVVRYCTAAGCPANESDMSIQEPIYAKAVISIVSKLLCESAIPLSNGITEIDCEFLQLLTALFTLPSTNCWLYSILEAISEVQLFEQYKRHLISASIDMICECPLYLDCVNCLCSLSINFKNIADAVQHNSIIWRGFQDICFQNKRSALEITSLEFKRLLATHGYDVPLNLIDNCFRRANLHVDRIAYVDIVALANARTGSSIYEGIDVDELGNIPFILRSLMQEDLPFSKTTTASLFQEISIFLIEIVFGFADSVVKNLLLMKSHARQFLRTLSKLLDGLYVFQLDQDNINRNYSMNIEMSKLHIGLVNIASMIGVFGVYHSERSQELELAPKQLLSTMSTSRQNLTIQKKVVLPISMKTLFVSFDRVYIELLVHLSCQAMNVLTALMDQKRFESALEVEMIHTFCTFPIVSQRLVSSASQSINFCQILIGLIHVKDSPSYPELCILSRHAAEVLLQVLRRLDMLSNVNRELVHMSHITCVDCLGLENISSICHIICTSLASVINWANQVAILDLLIVLINNHPIVYCLLLSVHQDSDQNSNKGTSKSSETDSEGCIPILHNASANDSKLANCIVSLLQMASKLLEDCPLFLHKLYELIISMMQASSHNTIAGAFMILLKIPNFWDLVTVPLMIDLPVIPSAPDATTTKHWVCFCHVTLAHASSLRLLTLERFGLILSSSKEVRSADEFYARVMQSSRFSYWATNYLKSTFQSSLVSSFVNDAMKLGCLPFEWTDGNRDKEAISVPSPMFGTNYLFNRSRVCIAAKFCQYQGNNKRLPDSWKQLLLSLEDINLRYSVWDCEMQLIQSFGQFLETYLLPAKIQSNPVSFQHQRLSGVVAAVPNSPQIGSSPASRIESSFAGDRRSFEIVGKLQKQLVEVCESANVSCRPIIMSTTEMRVVGEHLRLLCSMLHHQLKDVTLAAADPNFSTVETRDQQLRRLDCNHIFSLTRTLLNLAATIFSADCPGFARVDQQNPSSIDILKGYHSAEHAKVAQSAQVWLLACLLLLLEALGSHTVDSSPDEIYTDVLSYAVDVISIESSRLDENSTLGTFHVKDDQLEPLCALQLCVTLSNLCLPHCWAELESKHTSKWTDLIQRKYLYQAFVSLFSKLQHSLANFASTECDFSKFDSSCALGSDGDAIAKIRFSGDNHATPRVKFESAAMNILCGVLDMFLNKFSISLPNDYICNSLLHLLKEINICPVLFQLQECLIHQNCQRSGLQCFLGYSAITGEECLCMKYWQRCLLMIEMIMTHQFPFDRQGGFFEGTSLFIKKFIRLLCLPLAQKPNMRYSVQLLNLANSSVAFFLQANRFVRSWRSFVTSETVTFIFNQISILCSRLICLLPASCVGIYFCSVKGAVTTDSPGWNGDNISTTLRDCFVAISKNERLGLAEHVVPRKRKMSMSRKPSIAKKSQAAKLFSDNVEPVERQASETQSTSYGYGMLTENAMLTLIASILALLCENFEEYSTYEAQHFSTVGPWIIGKMVIARLPISGTFIEGTVVDVDLRDKILLIQLPEENSIFRARLNCIVSIKNPRFPFQNFFDDNEIEWSQTEISDDGNAEPSSKSFAGVHLSTEWSMRLVPCSTGHLLRLLCYVLLPQTSKKLIPSRDLLQFVAELCVSQLLCELKDTKNPHVLENLELILRALAKYSASAVPSVQKSVEFGLMFTESLEWAEFCAGVVAYLHSVGVEDKSKQTQKSPEKTPAKRINAPRRLLEYVPNPPGKGKGKESLF